jgi:endonuclease YncB( thermonuclease family)
MTGSAITQYVVLDGEITEVGDGDTIKFVPRDPELLKKLPTDSNPRAQFGAYPIRFQGIDTPELHISVDRPKLLAANLPHAPGKGLPKLPRPVHAQPMGDEAGRQLKTLTGFDEFGVQQKAGVVLVSETDVYGRLIAYAFLAEDAEDLLGTTASTIAVEKVDAALLKQSLNFAMIAASMAYYTGYSRMPAAHRELFAQAAAAARAGQQGIWKLDPGWDQPLTLDDEGAVGPDSKRLILPKLYRRCISYLFSVNADDFTGDLRTWMSETSKPKSDMVEVDGAEVAFIDLIALSGRNNADVCLTRDPFTMVFLENDDTEETSSREPVLTGSEETL